MKRRHVRAAAFVVTVGALLLATDTSAGGTELLCLNAQGQFIVCPAGTVPVSPYLLLPPTTGSAALSPHPDTGPVVPTNPPTSPADTRESRLRGPKASIEGAKPRGGGLHRVLITLALLVFITISGTFVYWISRRRFFRAGDQAPATTTALTDSAAEESNGERSNTRLPVESRVAPRAAQTASISSELDTDQLQEVRDREIEGEFGATAKTNLLLATTGPNALAPLSSDAPTPLADNTSNESETVIAMSEPRSEQPSQVKDGVTTTAAPDDSVEPSPTEFVTAVPTLLSIRHLVDDTFGEGMFRFLSQAALDDVVACLDQDRVLDAAFSAAHYLALGHDPNWSRSNHDRMVEAKRATIEDHHRTRQLRMAASACASLRLLQPESIPGDLNLYASVLRSDLQNRLSHHQIDLRATGTAADLYLLSGQWLPNEQDTRRLIRAADSAARPQSDNDPIIEAARVALWLLVTLASRNGPGERPA